MTVPNERITAPDAQPGKTALYQFFDETEQLLYIGITNNPRKRWADHRRYAATTWWPKAARADVDWYDTRRSAATAELRVIRTRAPLYNAGGAPSRHRALKPGERLVPYTNLEKFYAETGDRFWEGHMHMHEAIADVLQGDIRTGRLAAGTAMPTATALVARFGVSVATVRRAMGHVVSSGHAVRRGEGTGARYFVAE